VVRPVATLVGMDLTSMLSGSLRLSATGPVHPDEVWDRYTRPARWPGWSPHLREVDYPQAVVQPGTTGRVTGVGGLVAVFRIDAVDHEARTWSWSVRSGPLRLSFDHGVEPAEGDSGSTAWLVTHALWPVAVGYAPLARLALGRLVTPA
jgi:hypothetical protein